jgi:sortase A
MARDRRPADELSIEELEILLARKRRAAREARLQAYRRSGRTLTLKADNIPVTPADDFRSQPEESGIPAARSSRRRPKGLAASVNILLLIIEAGAVLGLAFVLFSGISALRQLNQDVAESRSSPAPQATPLITAVVLPSGHTPPTAPGGAQPNEAEIPANLRPLVQSLPVESIPTAGPDQARSLLLPTIWNDAAPVVQGDGWEQLKKGIGQHIGSGNPGVPGNLVLSAHNDIFGELFHDLDKLKPGDQILVSTGSNQFEYRVTGLKIVEPTDVSVMEPTSRSTITLISCYPYLIDNQRIVVFGELVGG